MVRGCRRGIIVNNRLNYIFRTERYYEKKYSKRIRYPFISLAFGNITPCAGILSGRHGVADAAEIVVPLAECRRNSV